jgi:hypothetical protein
MLFNFIHLLSLFVFFDLEFCFFHHLYILCLTAAAAAAAAATTATRVWLDSPSHEMSSFIEYIGS